MRTSFARSRATLLAAIAGLGVCSSGCGLFREDPVQEAAPGRIADEDHLREALRSYGDQFAILVQNAVDEIVRQTPDLSIRREAVRWKIRAVGAVREIVLRRDPRSALVDAWALGSLMRSYFEEGEGAGLFGAQHPLAVAAAVAAEEGIERIAASYLDEANLDRAREQVRAYVQAHPILKSGAGRPGLPSEEKKGSLVSTILGAPSSLNPFGGLDEGAKAIREFAEVADRFTEVVSHLPETIAWNAEWLLYDLEERETIRALRGDLQEVSRASASLAQTADRLPGEVERIVRTTFEELEARQGSLQETVAAVRGTVEEADRAIGDAQALAASLERAAEAVARAGAAWEATAHAFGAGDEKEPGPRPIPPDGSPPAEDGGGFDPKEFGAAADRLTATAAEIRTLVKEVRDLAGSAEVGRSLEGVETLSRSTIDHLAWRGLQLLGAGVVAALLYRLVAPRLHRAR